MQEDRKDAAEVDEDGGRGIAVAMESRKYGLTELRKLIAAQRIYGFTKLRY